MRIALYGNTANNLYQIARALRMQAGLDAHLYLNAGENLVCSPENDDPELKNNYPEWIHQKPLFNSLDLRRPWRSTLTKELSGYDLSIVSDMGPIFAQFTGKPFCFFVTGGDLTRYPFPLRFWFLHKDLPWETKKLHLWIGFWQWLGIRRATEIWSQGFSPYTKALKRIGVDSTRVSRLYFPIPIDESKFQYDSQARNSSSAHIRRIVANYDFVVFHPSRLMIRNHPALKESGQWKRNEILFEGFALFLEGSGAQRAVLVLIDRAASGDVELARQIIGESGIEKHVLWLKTERPTGFTRHELITLYSVADVVADDFGIGWFGGVVLEALSTGKPVISYIDESVMRQMYSWHPILSASSPRQIAEHLHRLYHNPEQRLRLGREGRSWIERFHSYPTVSKAYDQNIVELMARLRAKPHLSAGKAIWSALRHF